jgi:hypothetical protein
VEDGVVGDVGLADVDGAQRLAVDGDGVALEWFRDDCVVERVAAESLGPFDSGGLVAGCDVGRDGGKRDRAGLREPVEEAFEPEVVVGVGVGDVDRGQRPAGRRDASCQLGDVALRVLGVDEVASVGPSTSVAVVGEN